MSGGVTFFMACVIVILAAVVLYQRFLYRKGIQAKLKEISRKLSDILENDSDEQIMVFTDNKALMELCGQINLSLIHI